MTRRAKWSSAAEALTRKQLVERFERATGRPITRRHVPRLMLRAGSAALRRIKPVEASFMSLALDADLQQKPLKRFPMRTVERRLSVSRRLDRL